MDPGVLMVGCSNSNNGCIDFIEIHFLITGDLHTSSLLNLAVAWIVLKYSRSDKCKNPSFVKHKEMNVYVYTEYLYK